MKVEVAASRDMRTSPIKIDRGSASATENYREITGLKLRPGLMGALKCIEA